MAVRERLLKALGGTPREVLSVENIESGIILAGMDVSRPFSPGEPSRPFDGMGGIPRTRDYQTGYNIASRPRTNEQVAFTTLRGLVDSYDVAQMCIWHRIDSIRSLEWGLVARKGETGDLDRAISMGEAFFRKPDGEMPFQTWLAKYLYDILAFDAGTLHKMRNVAGRAIGLRVIDGTTIAPLQDYNGNRPADPAPAYVQFAQGVPWEWIFSNDMVYEPFRPLSNSVYGKAPLESILLNANTDLRFQQFFLNSFTEGNVPEGFAGAPESWTPEQIREYQETWDSILYGDDTQKHQIKWVPHGTKFDWTKDNKFDEQFSLFLMRKTAAAYHVTPADLGFTETVNRASGETQADVQFRVGDLPLIQHIQGILSRFIQDDLGLPLDFVFDTGKEVEDRYATAQANEIYIQNGVISPSEVREDIFGRGEPDGIPVPRYVYSSRSGPIPLSALYAVAGPIDLEDAAPVPGGPLPHKPFSLVEGVAPQKPPDAPPLAVVRYPQDNAASVQAEAAADNSAVLKDAGAGITGATVAVGDPMLEDPEDDGHRPQPVAKAAELRAFSKFSKARVRDGRWRDFNFETLTAHEAQEANRRGRVRVLKAVSVAGLAVRAADTGRVLMLQRSLDPSDPAAGMWEFPGGHMEEGESVLQAAVREWCEETGCVPPMDGTLTGGWTSSNGIYQGTVLQVPSEASVDLSADWASNPDDPDGDWSEACAWWDPAHLTGNPAVRPEVLADLPLILPDLVVKGADEPWGLHPFRRIEDALAEEHTPAIQAALRASVSKSQIRAAVEAYLAQR
jgi:8-oxo-dGTP pyrophosphatase MutT (NUDIX family)